ncbi:F-box/LRR-repeat protein 13-like [Bidens hawaiensis]|uniref:F-box/LRR-repeat protein 13-like n=1 Tax=Bidens hawaiensis TaxID=980011 RepID=UPI00404AB517
MPDDVLVMILSRLIVKDAVVTGSLSTRWKHLWRNLTRLDFDGTESLNKIGNDEMLCGLERGKFVNQVNNVISSHNHGMVQRFRVRFDLDCSYSECIDEWIQFAIDKKVEVLELNLAKEKNAIVKLPNVKKLMLVIVVEEDNSLLEYTSIARACPKLETFSVSPHWYSPKKRRRKVRHVVAPEGHKHLKLLEIVGYYGRISDLELAVYAIDNAVGCKKIVIDPVCDAFAYNFSKREEAA